MANSNSFWGHYEVLTIGQENKYLGKFSYDEAILMSTHNIQFHDTIKKISLDISFLEQLEAFRSDSKTISNHLRKTSHRCSSHRGFTVFSN